MNFLSLLTKHSPDSQQTDNPEVARAKKEEKVFKKIKDFSRGLVTVKDIIAPEAIELDFTYQKINSAYTKSFFAAGYPRTVLANWLNPLINFTTNMNVSMFVYPANSDEIINNLKRKITEMGAEIQSDLRNGKITNINTEVKLEDAIALREQLAKGTDKFFQFGLYVTVFAKTKDELDRITKSVRSSLGSLLIVTKTTAMQMGDGFKTTLPMGVDWLNITRNMDTTSLATTFPFTSSELTMETGIVYGINEHNDSLVIFDRFKTENANMVIFAKSGAGKSYTVKLEIIRQMMFGAEVVVLDPEHEYEDLCIKVEGTFIDFSFESKIKINPFDLANVYEEGENELGQKIITLHGLLKVMLGEMTSQQEAILDKSLVAAYKAKGITPDPITQTNEPPLMEDLYKALIGMENEQANDIAARLEKYIIGSFRGLFDQKSNININNQLTVFSVKEIEEGLRPIAMYVILDYIWTRIKKSFKKRLLIIDEAWYFMKSKDSASFLFGMAKRARKYYLGITTISQDVEDFLRSEYGKAIVSNSSIQFLMKQSPVSLDELTKTFHLSQGEQQLLMMSDVGEGIFFAGHNHVALRVVASQEEHEVVTTNPEEKMKKQKLEEERINQLAKKEQEADILQIKNKQMNLDSSNQNSTFPNQKNDIVMQTTKNNQSPEPTSNYSLSQNQETQTTTPPPTPIQEPSNETPNQNLLKKQSFENQNKVVISKEMDPEHTMTHQTAQSPYSIDNYQPPK